MIPLKLETLLAGRTVEQNRVEYKEGWNPNDIIHTICAFANDLHNVNGGYLVIGIRAEDGIPVLPPKGLPMNILDSVQQEIFQYCNLITPRYIPRIEVINYKNTGVYLLYLWCSAGDGAALCYNKYSNVPGVLCVPPALRGGRAAAVALVAKQMAERGEAVLPEALLPDYHRLSQAERERAERLAAEAAAQNHQTENGKE